MQLSIAMKVSMQLSSAFACPGTKYCLIFTRAIEQAIQWFIAIYQSCKRTQIYPCVSVATPTESLIYPLVRELSVVITCAVWKCTERHNQLATEISFTLGTNGPDTTPLSTEFVIKAHQDVMGLQQTIVCHQLLDTQQHLHLLSQPHCYIAALCGTSTSPPHVAETAEGTRVSQIQGSTVSDRGSSFNALPYYLTVGIA